ncbi:MAG: hypothetical protein II700_06495 [Firmicutes bacterium]|nr:hypothetical protein [Bacillota bacterium]MBQ4234529.1 hypothetical protein [Bacillota bacterium]MBR0442536.1 hypothetical protein [Bacillota bacterium]
MERLKKMELYRKILLILTVLMVIVFSILYSVILRRTGFLFRGSILIPGEQDGLAVYSGRIRWKAASFAVSEGADAGRSYTVTFVLGSETAGPYYVKEDPSAAPKKELGSSLTGVEVRLGSEVLFRGGMMTSGGIIWLYNEDGSVANIGFSFNSSGMNTVMPELDAGESGEVISAPSAMDILDLLYGEKTSHRGDIRGFFMGVFMCALNAVSILFAEELFRWNLRFTIRDADRAEPSDWMIASRRFTWGFLVLMALIVFIVGLR